MWSFFFEITFRLLIKILKPPVKFQEILIVTKNIWLDCDGVDNLDFLEIFIHFFVDIILLNFKLFRNLKGLI